MEKDNNHREEPLFGIASDAEEPDERIWLELEKERQERNRKLQGRTWERNDLPRRIGQEDLGREMLRVLQRDQLTSPNIPPASTPTSPLPASETSPAAKATANNEQGQKRVPQGWRVVSHQQADAEPLDVPLPPGTCPLCKGSGWLRLDAPVGDFNFGRAVPCDCKTTETNSREIERLKRLSNLDGFRDLTFETFNARVKGVREAYEAALEYARDPNGWLLFMGNCGSGKTHLAAAIANYALHHMSMKLYFAVVPDLLDYLRATFEPDSQASYDERFDEIRNVPLLILDDLGTENAKPWAREKLYQIVNHRYNLKLPTVFTTNYDLDAIDGRIRSRMTDMALCKVLLFNEAADYRQLPQERRDRLWRSPGAEMGNSRSQGRRSDYK